MKSAISNSACDIALYVQKAIAAGRQPDGEWFSFSRKEIMDALGISATTFARRIPEATELLSTCFDFFGNFHVPLFSPGERNVFLEVRYENGFLKFKRNPLTLTDDFLYMWDELDTRWKWFVHISSPTYLQRKTNSSSQSLSELLALYENKTK